MIFGDFREFLTQFGKAPRSIGAIAPSSRHLAAAMMAPIDFAAARVVVEFGPGTGAMTEAIRSRLSPGACYVGVEVNERFCRSLSRRYPDLQFVNRGAEDIEAILAELGVGPVDAIVCGLPWASLPVGSQGSIMTGIGQVLRPGGVFVTFAYLQGLILPAALAFRRRLRAGFTTVETTAVVWRNLPPAFAYVCRR